MFADFRTNRHPVILFFMWLLLLAFNVYALPPGPFVIKEELTLHTLAHDDEGNYYGGIKPNLVDLDNDGDFDLVLGHRGDLILYFENIGNRTTPQFVQRHGEDNPFYGIDVGSYSMPTLLDLDGDGDFDLAVGTYPGILVYFENIGNSGSPLFMERAGTDNPLIIINVIYIDDYNFYGVLAIPTALDLDNDGDLDFIITSGGHQRISYFENIGNRTTPYFMKREDTNNPLSGLQPKFTELYGATAVSFASLDLDNDGDLDLVAGNVYGTLSYVENVGSPSTPVFILHEGFDNPFYGIDVISESFPASADIDGDGDPDLIVSGAGGRIYFFENKNLKDYERVFNWAESIFSDLLPPPTDTLELSPFHVRFYPETGIYLGYHTVDQHVYSIIPPSSELTDLGLLEIYFESAFNTGF